MSFGLKVSFVREDRVWHIDRYLKAIRPPGLDSAAKAHVSTTCLPEGFIILTFWPGWRHTNAPDRGGMIVGGMAQAVIKEPL